AIPRPADGASAASAAGRRAVAEDALDRARLLFTSGAPHPEVGGTDPRAATHVLRDLAVGVAELGGPERGRALAILARPTAGAAGARGYSTPSEVACSTHFCLHWVETTSDAPPLADAGGDGIPDWVEVNAATLERSWETEIVDYGYRPPKSDLGSDDHGPDGRVDVYLADVGADGLFGYCATDDPGLLGGVLASHDVSGYCVLDNDFKAGQFPGVSGVAGLQATAPHEFFHLVQFGYDVFEDVWFMESTATWMEDEVFDAVNQNRDYLAASSMRRGAVPVDDGDRRRLSLYGNWIFIRFLSEYAGSGGVPDPSIVRRAWELADASAGAPDAYSIQALEQAAGERGFELRQAFADFGAANLAPERFYEEGEAYPTPSIDRWFRVSAGRADTGWWDVESRHLTSSYLEFRPGAGLASRSRLRASVDAPESFAGSAATAVVFFLDGRVRFTDVELDAAGDGSRTLPFGAGTVARVVLVLTNAGTGYRCWTGSVFACSGEPVDDGRIVRYRATVV
ncbi:MAG: MXAN_6640 family putative metalloprotease, partial [Actinomycetota bacterium]